LHMVRRELHLVLGTMPVHFKTALYNNCIKEPSSYKICFTDMVVFLTKLYQGILKLLFILAAHMWLQNLRSLQHRTHNNKCCTLFIYSTYNKSQAETCGVTCADTGAGWMLNNLIQVWSDNVVGSITDLYA
jgi:hypothetical protein